MLGVDSSTEEGSYHENRVLSNQEPEDQPNCFARTLRLQKKLQSSDSSQMICSGIKKENKLALSMPGTSSFATYISAQDPYVFCSSSNNYSRSSGADNG